ncbi:MAG: hypothetical protein SV775_07145 [Thermodesulfobacteriota bacterium]|nr:hypothetical protein [Thermodesulfobacteriota bacterium]
MRNMKYYVPGSLLILIAVMIIAVPELFLALAAVSILMAGVGVLYIGHIIRRSETELINIHQWPFDDHSCRSQITRVPIFKRWRRVF